MGSVDETTTFPCVADIERASAEQVRPVLHHLQFSIFHFHFFFFLENGKNGNGKWRNGDDVIRASAADLETLLSFLSRTVNVVSIKGRTAKGRSAERVPNLRDLEDRWLTLRC